jgi:hypothetical protein
MSDGKGFRFWGWVGLEEIGTLYLSSDHAVLHVKPIYSGLLPAVLLALSAGVD